MQARFDGAVLLGGNPSPAEPQFKRLKATAGTTWGPTAPSTTHMRNGDPSQPKPDEQIGDPAFQRNHYPRVKGRVQKPNGGTFSATEAKAILYDLRDGATVATAPIVAITPIEHHGAYEVYVPARMRCCIVVTQAFSGGAVVYRDATVFVSDGLVPDVRYDTSADAIPPFTLQPV